MQYKYNENEDIYKILQLGFKAFTPWNGLRKCHLCSGRALLLTEDIYVRTEIWFKRVVLNSWKYRHLYFLCSSLIPEKANKAKDNICVGSVRKHISAKVGPVKVLWDPEENILTQVASSLNDLLQNNLRILYKLCKWMSTHHSSYMEQE